MEHRLRLHNGRFAYGARTIFHDVSIEVDAGDIVCILGANGCGKTTLLRCLIGVLPLSSGVITLNGVDTRTLSAVQIARQMGIVFQEHDAPFPYLVGEVVRMGRAPYLGVLGRPSAHDDAIAEQALATVGLTHLRDTPYTQISGGERQLVLIARTLCQEPDVILLDEPTAHLDFHNQVRVLQIARQLAARGLSVVMTTHTPDHPLLLNSRAALMVDGQLLAVGPAAKVITPTSLRHMYGIDVRLVTVDAPDFAQPMRLCVPVLDPA